MPFLAETTDRMNDTLDPEMDRIRISLLQEPPGL
jgi:hypothetical protein